MPMLAIAMLSVLPAEGVITLEDALRNAEENNIDLVIAKVSLESAIRNNNAASSYIPDISIDGSVSLDDMTAFGQSWGNIGGDLSLGISLDLGTDLITDGTLKRLNRENAAIDYMISAETLEEAVVSAYWNLALSRQAVELSRLAEEDSMEALASVSARYEAGDADELEEKEARLAVLQYAYERQAYEDDLELAYTVFSALTGISEKDFSTEEIPSIPQLSLPSPSELMKEHASSNLTIQSLDKALEIAKAETLDTRLERQIPSVSLSASYHLGAETRTTEWDDLKNDRGSISVAFSIPLSSYIPGSSGYLAVKEKEDGEKIAALNLKDGHNDLYYALEEDTATIRQAERAVMMAEETVAAAERAYELKKERYEAGYETFDEFSDARRDLLSAQLNLAESMIRKVIGLYSLSFDTGMDTEEIISTYITEENQ